LLTEKGQLLKDNTRGVRNPYAANVTDIEKKQAPEGPSRSLSTAVKNIVAIWASEPDGHQIGLCAGIESYARENGLNLQLLFHSDGLESAVNVLRSVDDYSIDGIIIYPYPHEGYVDALRHLAEKQFPLVCLDRQITDLAKTCSVEVYNLSGVYQATRFLIEKYHRPVYMLTDQNEHKATQDRYAGYCQAMNDAGYDTLIESHTYRMDLSENDPRYWPLDKRWLPGFLTAEKMLREVQTPCSVVCVYDYAARGLYESAAKRGLTIGKDIAVIGFDDLPVASLLNPPLSTVRQPHHQMGYEAARLLHRLITGQSKPPVHIYLPVELVIRESC